MITWQLQIFVDDRGVTSFVQSFTFLHASMSKRSVTEVVTNTSNDGQAYPKASGSGDKRSAVTQDEMGEFEDAWEDEVESDEDVVDANAKEGEDGAMLSHTTQTLMCAYIGIYRNGCR